MTNKQKIKIISKLLLKKHGAKLHGPRWWRYYWQARIAKRVLGMKNPSMTIGNGIVIAPKYKKYSNEWFVKLCHEICHVTQDINNAKYFAKSAYRCECELEAYMVSIELQKIVYNWVNFYPPKFRDNMRNKYKMDGKDADAIKRAAIKRISQVNKRVYTTDIGVYVAKMWGRL